MGDNQELHLTYAATSVVRVGDLMETGMVREQGWRDPCVPFQNTSYLKLQAGLKSEVPREGTDQSRLERTPVLGTLLC